MSIPNLTTVTTNNINVTTTGITSDTFIWQDQSSGVRIFEVLYLTVLCVFGTIGNLVVIFSIALERRVHAHGNIFIINLALADLVVTGLVVPTVLANVIKRGNALHVDGLDVSPFCTVIGFVLTASCTCSLCNLMFIALNRFWAVVKSGTYNSVFSRKRVYLLVLVAWLWSVLLVIPTQFGWGGIRYDPKIMVCSWDDVKDLSYNLSVTSCAVILPLCVIAFCYWRLFNTVRRSGKWVRSISIASGLAGGSSQHRRSMIKERALLRTLATTVVLFCCCWLPFGFTVMIDPQNIDKHAKKVFGWLALTNSCVNFIIYGVMNPIFRRGYKNLFLFLFTKENIKSYSTHSHGSITERQQRKSSLKAQNNNVVAKKESVNGNSKNDQIIQKETIITVASNQSTPRNHVLQTTQPLNNNNNDSQKALLEIDVDRLRANTFTANPRKKFKIKSLKHSSTLRGSKPVVNEKLKEEQDRVARSKRNSRMLLQISVSEEDVNDDTLPRTKSKKMSNSIEEDSSGASSSFNENINNNNIQEEEHPTPEAPKSCWDPPHRLYRSNSCSARTVNGTRYADHIIKSTQINKPSLLMDTKFYQSLKKSFNFSKSERSLPTSIK